MIIRFLAGVLSVKGSTTGMLRYVVDVDIDVDVNLRELYSTIDTEKR